jgi:urease accessory protein
MLDKPNHAGNGGERLFSLLQVANSSFPTGSFSHSYGFETWIHDGVIKTPADAERRCRDWLRYGVARGDGVAVVSAFRKTLYADMEGLVALNILVGALKLGREAKEASLKTGAAFLAASRDVFRLPEMIRLEAAMQGEGAQPHHAVVYGVTAAGMGFTEEQAIETYLWSGFSNLIAVAGRLLPIGQVDLQRMIAASAPLVEECAEIARTRDEEMMSSLYAGLDAASMRHERLATRLCIS